MSIGKHEESQGTLWLSYDQLPKSMGHAFYDHLQRVLLKGQLDSFAETLCEPYFGKAEEFIRHLYEWKALFPSKIRMY